MSTAIYEFNAQVRQQEGTRAAKRCRRDDQVPGILYGGGEPPQSILLSHLELSKAISNEAVFSHILTLKFGSALEKVVIKDLQRHPLKPRILHIDFQRIKATEKITMHVPLHIVGEQQCVGIKQGGVVSRLVNEIAIRCLPADLPEYINLDISGLSLGQSLHLKDLQLPSGVELATAIADEEHNVSVVSVHVPRVNQEEEPTGPAVPAEAASPEATAKTAAPGAPPAKGER